MQFRNTTAATAGWTVGFEADGRELLIVAIKATFNIPPRGEDASLAADQLPLTLADEFTGEPGLSSPRRETDYAHRKPFCDVLLNGSAYGPEGRPIETVMVGLRVGQIVKSFEVVGDRVWRPAAMGIAPTRPQPFQRMRISYDNAFGGTDAAGDDSSGKVVTFEPNPAGRGFASSKESLLGRPLPNTQEANNPVNDPSKQYPPMSFGPVGRHWWPRRRYAGTYDAAWLDTRAPFWPPDFDYRYFQSAPEDQQTAYLAGGEPVVLHNLTIDGERVFAVPSVSMPVMFIPKRGAEHLVDAVIDTLLIEPDEERFTITWRANYALRRDCHELRETIVGEMPQSWHRARRTAHKRHYASLADLVAATRGSNRGK
jgi:hypothetical protein